MRLLLDTHVLPWALAEPERLPARVQEWLVSPANDVLFSFDRILVAQAITEPARLLTVDPMLARYSELVEGIA